jgi:hypothetical protein
LTGVLKGRALHDRGHDRSSFHVSDSLYRYEHWYANVRRYLYGSAKGSVNASGNVSVSVSVSVRKDLERDWTCSWWCVVVGTRSSSPSPR